jgi:capsular polysaccharide transport system permease protein
MVARQSRAPRASADERVRAASLWLWRRGRPFLILLPTFLSVVYFGTIAADQYETESRFVVRSATRPEVSGALATLMQFGLGRSQDDTYAVQEFLTSRDAVIQLSRALPLPEIYSREGADFLARYPSVLYGKTEEELYEYFQRMISVSSNSLSGITFFRVRAFTPQDAQKVAVVLLDMGEQLVNRINTRIQRDAVANSHKELEVSQRRLIQSQIDLASFRNRELMIDPVRNAALLSEMLGKMSAELAETRAQITNIASSSPASPQVAQLYNKAGALEKQIATERARITTSSDGLAERIATYDRLSLERDFANRMMISAETELARSRSEAQRQQLYLERIAEPQLPDYSTVPHRLANIVTTFGANIIVFFVLWLVFAGVKEHGAERH